MELVGKRKLEKLKRKNIGNRKLGKAIDELVVSIESADWETPLEIKKDRPDADCVYGTFYFFDINVHRTLILVEFNQGEAEVVWAGNHQDYEATFKNNKRAIRNWLSRNDWI